MPNVRRGLLTYRRMQMCPVLVVLFVVLRHANCRVDAAQGMKSLPAVRELERQALDYRRNAIRSGRVVVTTSRILDGRTDRRRFEYIFDGKSLLKRWGAELSDGSLGPLNSEIVFVDKRVWIDAAAWNDNSLPVTREPIVPGQHGDCKPIVCDIRNLGMSADSFGLQCKFGMETILNRADRRNLKVSRGAVEFLGSWRIEGDLPDGQHVSVWLRPDKGMTVVRAESIARTSDGEVVFVMDAKLKVYQHGGIWFPETVRNWHAWNGGEPLEEEVAVVEEAEFNLPIDPTTFTYASLELAPGRHIIDRVKNGSFFWDGQRVLPLSPGSEVEHLAPKRPCLKWLFGAVSAMLAAAGAYVLFRRRQAA